MSLTKDFLRVSVPAQPGQPAIAPSSACTPHGVSPGGGISPPAPPPGSSPPTTPGGGGSITCSTARIPETAPDSTGRFLPTGRFKCITVCVDELGRVVPGSGSGSYCE